MRGIPVIATDRSGNINFFTAQAGFPISYDFAPIEGSSVQQYRQRVCLGRNNLEKATAALRVSGAAPELHQRLGPASAR